MRIGLDLDNVISDYDGLMEEAISNDNIKTEGKGIVNPNGRWISDKYGWSYERLFCFLEKNMSTLIYKLEVKRGVKDIIDRLLSSGNEVYIITHRYYPIYKTPFETTKNWLNSKNINYTKLIISDSFDKSNECLENNIDIFIDDSYRNCLCTIRNGIETYMMNTYYNKRFYIDSSIPRINNLEEIFNIISEKNKLKLYNKI